MMKTDRLTAVALALGMLGATAALSACDGPPPPITTSSERSSSTTTTAQPPMAAMPTMQQTTSSHTQTETPSD